MAHIGSTAACYNIFLDIPNFLRAISQSMHRKVGPKMQISVQLLEEIKAFDRRDPTAPFDEYLCDWWNYYKEWKTHPVAVDQEEAFWWHIEKVGEKFRLGPGPSADTSPDWQYGNIRQNKPADFLDGPVPPDETAVTTCQSPACKARLHVVLGEVQKANQVVRSLAAVMEDDKISAFRHVLHLRTLKRYPVNKDNITQKDFEKLMNMWDENDRPSTNKSLTPQTLSSNFSDSDPDYVP